MLLFAKLSSDFPIGGIDTWGLLKLLVAFLREVSSGECDVINCSKVAFRAYFRTVCRFLFSGCSWRDHLDFAIVATDCGPYDFRQLCCGCGEEWYLPAPESSEGGVWSAKQLPGRG